MIHAEDIDKNLGMRHRDAMLDLILAWGSLDGALGMMLSRILAISLPEGADAIAGMSSSARFAKIRKILKASPKGGQAAVTLGKYKKNYEKFSKVRNIVAHSHCAGIWSKNTDYVVFATFARVSSDNLAIDAVPIEQMKRATDWGKEMTRVALAISDAPYDDGLESASR